MTRSSTRSRPSSSSISTGGARGSASSTPIGGSARRPSRRSSMPLIKAGQPIDDPFIQVADGESLPAEGPIIVSLARWQEEQGLLQPRNAAIGVRLKPGDRVGHIAADLGRIEVIVLEFPKFNDGRAMSQARLLRE